MIAEPIRVTHRQRHIRRIWVGWLLLVVIDEIATQCLDWWQVWGNGAQTLAIIISGIAGLVGLIALIIAPGLIFFWVLTTLEQLLTTNESVLVGTYLGNKRGRTDSLRAEQKDPMLSIRITPFGVRASGHGQNWNANSYVRVETVPRGECWVDIYYEVSGRAAQHHHLQACIRADQDGHAVWNWQPQQYPEYVGRTRITAHVKYGRKWNDAIEYITLQS